MNEPSMVEAPGGARVVTRELEIAAPVDAVWRALTEAGELERWFPLEAHVEPGEGGVIRLSWGEAYDGVSGIEVWEPGRHLRIAFPRFDAADLATDYWLEGRGGRTLLRVVSSGFGADSSWDDAYEGVGRGWDFELLGLRHYLEHHRGRDRAVALAIEPHALTVDDAWNRLTGPDGWLGPTGLAGARVGADWSARTATGESLSGAALLVQPPHQFAGTVREFGNALLRVGLESGHGALPEAWIFLATWDRPVSAVESLAAAWRDSVRERLAG